ncbi:hypothetical protein SAMN04487830_104134 [Pseudobutyrivibrio sp. OR37]|uniref:hypothetical protein n=1 Tax=Pseudobutyrivibrio sp. OR37 TaxID=1798186 RepID=UPI0008E96A12|nr:hypothetical protein [Pseudobutyrivibrio sp. OR37]SFH66926.1 hypothetical protein SAMN04487830_104134 [Pseudobutyrivibrio sp. OR37]
MKKNKRRKRKRIISVTLIIVALLLIIGCAVYIGYNKVVQSSESSVSNSSVTNPADSNSSDTKSDASESGQVSTNSSTASTDFKLSDDLAGAIALIAQSYNEFDSTSVEGEAWQEFFTSHFLMNSHYGFEYLNDLTEKNSNIIDEEQAEYMSYSLTGVKSDFTFAEPLDYNNASSFLNDVYVENYTSEPIDDGVLIHAVITTTEQTLENDDVIVSNVSYNVDVKLITNPSSCFDGYSIYSLECIQQ